MTKNTKNKLKIAFVLDTTLDVEDGVQQYILTLGNWLRTNGHDVHYIVGESKRTDIPNMYSLSHNLKVSFNGNKVSIPLPTKMSKIKALLEDKQFDVLHVQVPYSPFYGAKIIKAASPKTVVIGTFHILPYGKIAYAGTWFLGRILSSNLKRFSQQISISRPNQVFSANTFRTNSIVIPNMVNLKEFRPTSRVVSGNKTVKILYLGRLTQRKGCEYLLDALGLALNTNPNIKFELKIAGKGEKLEILQNKAQNLGLDKYIKFLGYVSNNDKISLMQEADISVFPSYSGECFGIVLIEAIAAKSGSVIAGKNPGYESVLGSVPESIIDVKDTQKFSELMIKLINDKKFRSGIYVKQQKLIDQYDVEVVGNRVLEVYKNCISNNNHR